MNKRELLAKGIIALENIKENALIESENMRNGNEKLSKIVDETKKELKKTTVEMEELEKNTEVSRKDNETWKKRIKEVKIKFAVAEEQLKEAVEKLDVAQKATEKAELDLVKATNAVEKQLANRMVWAEKEEQIKIMKKELNEYYEKIGQEAPYKD